MYNNPFVYERVAIGLGDAIMLRPSINNNIRLHPERNHILHCHPSISAIFYDIEQLIIVPIINGNTIKEKQEYSIRITEQYENPIYYQLSTPCARIESVTEPNIVKSRQQIYCDVVGDNFDYTLYDVRFNHIEKLYAKNVLYGLNNNIGIHLQTNDGWRDYKYDDLLIKYFADNFDGNIFIFGKNINYKKYNNVYVIRNNNIREIWSLISMLDGFLGVDSFGIHASGSVGVKTFGIFGATNPAIRLLYKNVCWNNKYKYCRKQYCWYSAINNCKNKWCLNTMSPKNIFNSFLSFLSKYGGN